MVMVQISHPYGTSVAYCRCVVAVRSLKLFVYCTVDVDAHYVSHICANCMLRCVPRSRNHCCECANSNVEKCVEILTSHGVLI